MIRVAVLRGGPSEEYDVSLVTGASVLEALQGEKYKNKYEPIDVVISKSGEWLRGGVVKEPQDILQSVDVVFIGLHGAYGEDGTVQRFLEKLAVPYTGSGPFASAVAMNKVIAKDNLLPKGIKMARHMIVSRDARGNLQGIADSVASLLGYKYVVKPLSGGSSISTSIIDNKEMLLRELAKSLEMYEEMLVEEFIEGKEATCGVVNNFRNQSLYALPVIEVVPPPNAAFFDYEVKYDGSTEEICPGRFPQNIKNEIERLSKLVHQSLNLSQYSRSDFIVTDTDDVYFLEVNTLTGMTPNSLVPNALKAVGCSYEDFVDHLLTDARKV